MSGSTASAGRSAVTVYYAWGKERIAYTIVGTPTLKEPAATETWLDGTALRTLTLNGRLVVTWRRGGDTCVLSGSGIKAVGAADAGGVEGPGGRSLTECPRRRGRPTR